ncbi:MAG: TonB-dependent receptor [Smithella sp.]
MRKRYLIVLFLIVFSLTSFAEENTPTNTEGNSVPKVEEKSPAKTEEKDVTNLKEIVVTATRTEKDVESAPGTVNIVTKKEIETRNITTVDEALDTLSGVYNKRQSLTDIEASITLNGIPDQKRTLIMMDGIPLNDAFDGTVSFSALPTENVERVEVVQGPFSSLYGGNAMGGAVNIITQMPEKREFTLISGYGSSWNRGEAMDDFQKYYISYGDRLINKLSLLLSYGYKSTNGYPSNFNVQPAQPVSPPAGITGYSATTDNGQYGGLPAYTIGDTGDNAWWDDNLSFKARFDFTPDSKLSVSFMRMRYKYSYDDPQTYLKDASGNPVYAYGPPIPGYSSYTVNQSTFDYGSGGKEVNMYNIGYETEIGIVKTKFTLGLSDEGKNWYVTPGYSDSTTLTGGPGQVTSTPSQNYTADLLVSVPVLSMNILTFGGSFKTDWANSQVNNLTDWQDETSTTDLVSNQGGKDRTYAAFIQDEIMILSNLTAYIGFREDWWETYDGYANQFGSGGFANTYDSRNASSFSPKLSVVYKPFEITTLKADIGQAFRAPTVYELYSKWSYYGMIWSGNPDLKPETTTSWDVGIAQELWKGAKVGATYFDNQMQNLIYSASVPSGFENMNAGKAESQGVMLSFEQRFDKLLRLFANYTYTDGRIKENSSDPLSVGKRMTFLPDTMINAGVECAIEQFSGSVTGRYVGKVYSDDQNRDTINGVYTSYDPYFTADAKVSYKVTKFATVSASVDNIFNESYFSYYKAPGRSWFMEVTLNF